MPVIDPSVQVALVTGAFGLMIALISICGELIRRQNKALGEVRQDSAAAREQVQNSHTTNLRDDLDLLHDDVKSVLEMVRAHGYELGHLRRDVQQEQRERLAVAERLDSHMTTVASATAATVAAVVGGTHPPK